MFLVPTWYQSAGSFDNTTFGKLGGFYYPTQTCQNSRHSSVQKQSKTLNCLQDANRPICSEGPRIGQRSVTVTPEQDVCVKAF